MKVTANGNKPVHVKTNDFDRLYKLLRSTNAITIEFKNGKNITITSKDEIQEFRYRYEMIDQFVSSYRGEKIKTKSASKKKFYYSDIFFDKNIYEKVMKAVYTENGFDFIKLARKKHWPESDAELNSLCKDYVLIKKEVPYVDDGNQYGWYDQFFVAYHDENKNIVKFAYPII